MKTEWHVVERHVDGQFEIVTSVRDEDTHPQDLFDDTCDDIKEICDRIDRGIYVWFVAKVTVYNNGIELANVYLGGNLHKEYQEFLNPEYYWGDMVETAKEEALRTLHAMRTLAV